MQVYNKYLVKDGDTFNEENYPKVVEELAVLKEAITLLPSEHRAEIIISYLKWHSIRTEFAEANPKLTEVMVSNTHATDHLEGLFGACKEHKVFQQGFEAHLAKKLLASSVTF